MNFIQFNFYIKTVLHFLFIIILVEILLNIILKFELHLNYNSTHFAQYTIIAMIVDFV